nr:hypothetical protein [uncultured Desulfobacter sp.]
MKSFFSSAKQDERLQASTNAYFDLVCKHSSIIKKTIAEHGETPIAEYIANYPLPIGNGYQKKDDFFEIVYDYLLPIHGESIARRTVTDLSRTPVVLTANHHGIDFFAQSVQGTFLFSLILSSMNPAQSTIPVIACANVPLNNLTFPRGMLLYHTAKNDCAVMPQKIPIFSDKFKTSYVSLIGPIDKDQIKRTVNRIGKLVNQGDLLPEYGDVLHDILETDYGQTVSQGWQSYSEQSVVLNHRLWNRMFATSDVPMDLIYMDLEAIASRLLIKDLADASSLIYKLMFDPDITQDLISNLDCAPACWQGKKLHRRLIEDCSNNDVKRALGNCGTHFFWGVGLKNKLVPMVIEGLASGQPQLKGKDERDNVYTLAFDPLSIIDALKDGRLLPSLFTCYTSISIARGIGCIGGYYQSEYLPCMQQAIVKVLNKQASMKKICNQTENIPTGCYLSGMQTVMTKAGENNLIPAGPIEIIGRGGLNNEDVSKIKRLTIKEAHLASLFETIPDIVPFTEQDSTWHQDIPMCCNALLKDKIPLV